MPSPTILLLELDPERVEQLRLPLTEAGYRVEVAHDGIEGLAAFERVKPDLVLIEPMIPKKNGFEVCREIKRGLDGRDTPVVIVTSFYPADDYAERARRDYGCDGYLEHPLDHEVLLATCRGFLDRNGDLPGHEEQAEASAAAARSQRTEKPATTPRRRRRWLVGAASAAAVVALGGLFVFLADPLGGATAESAATPPASATPAEPAATSPASAAPAEPTWSVMRFAADDVELEESDDPRVWLWELPELPEPAPADADETEPTVAGDAGDGASLADVLEELIVLDVGADTAVASGQPTEAALGELLGRLDADPADAALPPVDPPPVAASRLALTARSNVKAGWLSLVLDGREIYARELAYDGRNVRRFLKKMVGGAGETFEASIAVAPGPHELAARVVADGRSYGTSIGIDVPAGATLGLRLVAGRHDVALAVETIPVRSAVPGAAGGELAAASP